MCMNGRTVIFARFGAAAGLGFAAFFGFRARGSPASFARSSGRWRGQVRDGVVGRIAEGIDVVGAGDVLLEPASGFGFGGGGVDYGLQHFGFETLAAGLDLLAERGIAKDFAAESARSAADGAGGLVQFPTEGDQELDLATFFVVDVFGAAGARHGR